MVSSPNLKDAEYDALWSPGYVSLHFVPSVMKYERPKIAMSYPLIRQAVKDNALKVIEIGNQMRVTRANLDAFYKVVEEGHYCPSSNPSKSRWLIHPSEIIMTTFGELND